MKYAVAAFVTSFVFAVEANAQSAGHPAITSTPEMDASAGISAIALVAACALLVYNRIKK